MLTLIYPDKIGSILEGWVNAYREGGWLPKWASPGYRDSMVGTYCDVVLADAIVKGVSGFDVNAAYASMLKDADETPHRFGTGRKYLSEYKNLGFVAKESDTLTLRLRKQLEHLARKMTRPDFECEPKRHIVVCSTHKQN